MMKALRAKVLRTCVDDGDEEEDGERVHYRHDRVPQRREYLHTRVLPPSAQVHIKSCPQNLATSQNPTPLDVWCMLADLSEGLSATEEAEHAEGAEEAEDGDGARCREREPDQRRRHLRASSPDQTTGQDGNMADKSRCSMSEEGED
mmetsp:Transcript_35576/g.71292  ORF Transcript_35576/g.71292 Transcript_35576/m.71292 type:complete len:147 (-) Transcript_35576:925-1365(-)